MKYICYSSDDYIETNNFEDLTMFFNMHSDEAFNSHFTVKVWCEKLGYYWSLYETKYGKHIVQKDFLNFIDFNELKKHINANKLIIVNNYDSVGNAIWVKRGYQEEV